MPTKFVANVLSRETRGISMKYFLRSTSVHLSTPFHNPKADELIEIEVTDPSHPLFGRRFHLIPRHRPLHETAHVRVLYRTGIHLRIPARATTLTPSRPSLQAKLSVDAITELVTLAEDCEALCLLARPTSGLNLRQSSNPDSMPTSRRSSRR
ncbi:MAG: hypothetical protein M3R24_11265 [Chloroflexota bacterium]|nr:hypothetical protein [Chloroflexota bacterium]